MSGESFGPTPRWQRFAIGVLILFVLVLLILMFTTWLQKFVVFGTFNFVVAKVVDASGISIYLVKGILVVVLIPFFLALREIGKIPLFKGIGHLSKSAAWGIVICYTSGFFLTMYVASRDTYFHHTGPGATTATATKYYAVTPEGVRFFDTEGFDPKYGVRLKPVTPQMIATLERAKRGDVAKPLAFRDLADVTFFDPLTGEAKVWFCRTAKGDTKLFSTSGFDPESGQILQPVTPAFLEELKARRTAAEERQAAEARRSEQAARDASVEAERARLVAESTRAEAHEKAFRDRYVNPGSQRSGDGPKVAIVILGQANGVSVLREELRKALRERGIDSTDGLFRPAFVADGDAAKLFGGDAAVARRLRLADRVTAVVTINAAQKIAVTGALDADLKTAAVTVAMNCLNVVTFTPCGSGAFTVKGVGFSGDTALKNGLANAGPDIQKLVLALAL